MQQQEEIQIRPQPGPQEQFCSSDADIVFYGGAAGAGKSYALLIEPLRHINVSDFKGVIFRKTTADLRKPGSILDESKEIYPLLGAEKSNLTWSFPIGMKLTLAHMQYEKNIFDWHGAQIPYIGFDEVTQFSKKQFFYMLSRNRSKSGIPGYIRATCNPDPDSWVSEFISWWIDQDTGYPIQNRSGIKRYFLRAPDDSIIWGLSLGECYSIYEREHGEINKDEIQPKSVTFIPANIFDNQKLIQKDPSYLRNLHILPKVDRERLLKGNWKIRATAGTMFQRSWFEVIDVVPSGGRTIRYWDRAATKKTETNDPDFTVGLKLKYKNGITYILDVERFMEGPFEVERRIKNTASRDTIDTEIWLETDPGQAGKFEASHYVKALAGYVVKLNPVQKTGKEKRAMPASAQAEAGNIKIVRGEWNDKFLRELENFPDGRYKDQVDCLSGGCQVLFEDVTGDWTDDMVNTSPGIASNMDW